MKNGTLCFSVFFLIISFLACKKSTTNPSGSYFMNFSVNGVAKSADSILNAQISVNANGSSNGEIILVGVMKSTDSVSFIEIILDNQTSPISVGTYTDTMSNILLSADYSGYSSGIWEMGMAKNSGTPISTHLVVNISSISNSTVMGTFSGDFYRAPNFTTPVHITDGGFNLKFH